MFLTLCSVPFITKQLLLLDSITHIALGACIGEAFLGNRLGKKAMLWGALSQSLPDIDFVAGFYLPLSEELLAHRGFTHSLLFIVVFSPLLALAADKLHTKAKLGVKTWTIFLAVEMLVHILLDGFNNYGTGWLEPFSHQRFSFNTIYVADPFLSIWPIMAFVALLLLPINKGRRKFWSHLGILIPTVYLSYASCNKLYIDYNVRRELADQHITYTQYFTTPAPLNNWLWYVVAGSDSGFHVGFRSVFDKHPLQTRFFPRQENLLHEVEATNDLDNLKRFSQGFYTVDKRGDSLVFNDLRFGQIIGWVQPNEQFVFHYYLSHKDQNEVIVQRGRFAKWDKKIALALVRRAIGKEVDE